MALAFWAFKDAGCQITVNEAKATVGDSPTDPGMLSTDLSAALAGPEIKAAMRKVAEWENGRTVDGPSQDWTFATLYMGMLSASETLGEPRYHDEVLEVARHFAWQLGPRQTHADDEAIGQVYLALYNEDPEKERIGPLRKEFDAMIKRREEDADKPLWWWCDALFMAPPVWARLSKATGDPRYFEFMDRNWHVSSDLLWDKKSKLFLRDVAYRTRRERNGKKVFWSRGNGWVMGGLVGVLEQMDASDRRRPFYIRKLKEMAGAVAAIQSGDGLWRPGLLDADAYRNPEISGSAFFVYAITWGIRHGILNRSRFEPVVARAWAGILHHIYVDGRLGDIQPVGEAPGAYGPGASYVFGVGAFLLAGSELSRWVETKRCEPTYPC